jgi:hypothetical protein
MHGHVEFGFLLNIHLKIGRQDAKEGMWPGGKWARAGDRSEDPV